MKVRILAPVAIYGESRKPGDTVECDMRTAENLTRKGRVAPVGDEPQPQNREEEQSHRLSKRGK